jgi:Peptidase family S41
MNSYPMKGFFHLFIFVISGVCFSCNTSKDVFNPDKKFPPAQLKQDYGLFRNILEESHPGLYWYTTKDSLDNYFNKGYGEIHDSMTETQFRVLLSYVITKINCGHTSVRGSKQYSGWIDTARLKLFPLTLKLWGDTMVVTYNINRRDSVLKKGTVLKSINGLTQPQLRDSLFNYQVTDGYSISGKYQSLSTGFNFGVWYSYIFGSPQRLNIKYLDSFGEEREITIPFYDARADSLSHVPGFLSKRMPGRKRDRKFLFLSAARNLQMDTVEATAFMTVNTFSHGNRLKSFFRRSFKLLDEKKIRNLVIDVRSNGGGEASNSTLLTRYLIDKKFKLADSLYAVNRHSQYGKYIEKDFLYRVMMNFVTKKHSDGKYHFGYFERHFFHPKSNHHFDGRVYLLIGGNSFSATTLFAGSLKGQKNVTLVGEETGGGYYGNSAWVIPDVVLPNTKIRFRLPKFRLVMDKNREKNGRGVMPDVWALPTTEAIRKGIDFKAWKVKDLINQRENQTK